MSLLETVWSKNYDYRHRKSEKSQICTDRRLSSPPTVLSRLSSDQYRSSYPEISQCLLRLFRVIRWYWWKV